MINYMSTLNPKLTIRIKNKVKKSKYLYPTLLDFFFVEVF